MVGQEEKAKYTRPGSKRKEGQRFLSLIPACSPVTVAGDALATRQQVEGKDQEDPRDMSLDIIRHWTNISRHL